MHKLVRRAAYAIAGVGVGVAATLALVTAPSAAQTTTEPESMNLFVHYEDFNVPSQAGVGDTVTASGWLAEEDDPGRRIGSSWLVCHVAEVTNQGWLGQCDGSHEVTGGDIYFTFLGQYDTTSDKFLEADAAIVGGTDTFLRAGGSAFLNRVDTEGQSFLIEHNWLLPDA